MVHYNNLNWDITDKEEVDLIKAAIEASATPIHALDAIYDAGRKLLRALEAEANEGKHYEIHTEKMEYIEKNFRELADRVATLHYRESSAILDHV